MVLIKEKKVEGDNPLEFEKEFKYYVIDRVISFPLILEKAGYEDYDYMGNVYCPFHDNTDTPAAKMYQDDEGDKLYCYGECRKLYTPSDVIKKGLLKVRVNKIFYKIWKKLSPNIQEKLKEAYGKPKKFLSDDFEEVIVKMEDFKKGKIDYEEYLGLVLEGLEKL